MRGGYEGEEREKKNDNYHSLLHVDSYTKLVTHVLRVLYPSLGTPGAFVRAVFDGK